MLKAAVPGKPVAFLAAALALGSAPPARAVADLPYAFGADLSFLKQQEDGGRVFRDRGAARPGMRIFRDHGFGWVRLRLFHTPTDLPNTLSYTLAMARQAKDLGFDLLLDLHYSDTWADPGQQTPPAAWKGLGHSALQDSVFAYTRAVLARFAAAGLMPDMVQIGNEINGGILWPDGLSSDFGRFADLIEAGIRGVDSAAVAAPRPSVMLHIACGGDTVATRWFYDAALARGLRFEAIGQSYYPMWHGTPADLARNLAMMGRRYAKDIYVVETALGAYPGGGSPVPLTDDGQAGYVRMIDSLVRATPNGRGKGWLWWEPTGDQYLGTSRGLFDRNGNARPALYALEGTASLRPPAPPRVSGMLPSGFRPPVRAFAGPAGPVRADGARLPLPAMALPDRP